MKVELEEIRIFLDSLKEKIDKTQGSPNMVRADIQEAINEFYLELMRVAK